MKERLAIFFIFLFLLVTYSCRKSVENNGLTGNWKLVEEYYGYVNGGNFQWNSIPHQYSHRLLFTTDGNYLKTEIINGTQVNCIGTYLLNTGNNLEISSDCNTVTEKVFISELTSKILIFDRSVREGVIRYKYSAVQ